ncbi:MAG: hypothetical protein IIU19_02360, partial [Oscillospiraceae bacterium]|nr:hypothetical protein [Oscillospiraceae bacterium]
GSAGLQQQETPPFDRGSHRYILSKALSLKTDNGKCFNPEKLFYYSSLNRIVLEAGAPPTTEVTDLRA